MLKKCAPALFDNPVNPHPGFHRIYYPKQEIMVKNGQKWLKNIYVVPLGSLAAPVCLSPRSEHLFSTILHVRVCSAYVLCSLACLLKVTLSDIYHEMLDCTVLMIAGYILLQNQSPVRYEMHSVYSRLSYQKILRK